MVVEDCKSAFENDRQSLIQQRRCEAILDQEIAVNLEQKTLFGHTGTHGRGEILGGMERRQHRPHVLGRLCGVELKLGGGHQKGRETPLLQQTRSRLSVIIPQDGMLRLQPGAILGFLVGPDVRETVTAGVGDRELANRADETGGIGDAGIGAPGALGQMLRCDRAAEGVTAEIARLPAVSINVDAHPAAGERQGGEAVGFALTQPEDGFAERIHRTSGGKEGGIGEAQSRTRQRGVDPDDGLELVGCAVFLGQHGD